MSEPTVLRRRAGTLPKLIRLKQRTAVDPKEAVTERYQLQVADGEAADCGLRIPDCGLVTADW